MVLLEIFIEATITTQRWFNVLFTSLIAITFFREIEVPAYRRKFTGTSLGLNHELHGEQTAPRVNLIFSLYIHY